MENFFSVLKKIEKLINNKIKVKYLFIDDGSTDNTKIKLEEFKPKSNLDIDIFSHEKNMGYGKTLQNSIIIANTDYLITYDPDCTYDYNLIFYLLENIEKYNHDIINVSYKLSPKRLFLF